MNIFSARIQRGAAILLSGFLVFAMAGEATACEEVGRLVVTKVVVGTDTAEEFEICVNPVGGGVQRCEYVVGNGTVTFENLPVGEYVVTETDPPPSFSVVGSGATVTVESGDTANATVTNTWIPPAEEFGRVEVTKAVSGEGAPVEDAYEICLAGPDPSTTKICKTVVGEGTVKFEELAPGTYTVTETDPGTEYDVTITQATVEVKTGEVASATVTNKYTKQESLPPVTPVPPVAPVTAAAPAAPATPTNVAAQTALPATGSEGRIAAVATILVTAGVALTLLSRRREPQEA